MTENNNNQTIEPIEPTPVENTTTTVTAPKRQRKNLSKNIKDMSVEELRTLNNKQAKEIIELKNLVNMYKHNAEEAYKKVQIMGTQLDQVRNQASKAVAFIKTQVQVLFTTIDLLEKEIKHNGN